VAGPGTPRVLVLVLVPALGRPPSPCADARTSRAVMFLPRGGGGGGGGPGPTAGAGASASLCASLCADSAAAPSEFKVGETTLDALFPDPDPDPDATLALSDPPLFVVFRGAGFKFGFGFGFGFGFKFGVAFGTADTKRTGAALSWGPAGTARVGVALTHLRKVELG
jgi:hypothetical protein